MMKAVGITAEYNPFHNGHVYHAETARRMSGADCVIAVMSGDFTQRGEPAVCGKWERARTAVKSGAVDLVIELPFALPTAVAGIALTHMTTTNGWIGKFFYELFGVKIAYTRVGITIALIFIGIPFVVRSVQPVLEKIDLQYEEAAVILGASRLRIFWKVIFPEVLPALISGFTIAFARCLGEYGSVVFIAGNTPYETEIAPLLIMSELQEFDYAAATSIALVMLAMAFVILSINAILQSIVSRRVSGLA